MTEEEYRAQMAERERLVNELNRLINQYNELVVEYNQLQAELETAVENVVIVNNNAVANAKVVLPKLDVSVSQADQVLNATEQIYKAIEALHKKCVQVNNISTSSKKLTELDDIYNKNYRFYAKLRKIALGYVIGIDSNIISSETLRTEVEKQQLKNSDYWLAYALSALMLWISNEKDSSERAMLKALKIDEYKSILFFMLVNLRFGRPKIAQKWYELFAEMIDIFDIKPEFQFILQAYLHNGFSNDKEFDKKVKSQLIEMLQNMRESTVGYDNKITDLVIKFADTYPYSTDKEYMPIYENCSDYSDMMENLSKAEKNVEIMKYYLSVYDEDDSSADTLKENLENVLYDLINQYDEKEKQIFNQIKYHEYVVKANGDIALAKKAFALKYDQGNQKLSLDRMIFGFAFSDIDSDIDPRLRKFSITFLIDQIKNGFEKYRQKYLENIKEKFNYKIFNIDLIGSPETEKENYDEISKYYKKNRNRIVYSDKRVKTYMGISIASIVFLAITILIAILLKSFPLGVMIPFIIFIISTITFVLLWIFRAKKRAKSIDDQKQEAFKILHKLNESITQYRKDFQNADDNYNGLVEALNKFKMED